MVASCIFLMNWLLFSIKYLKGGTSVKRKTIFYAILMIVILITLIPLTVYAWISYTNSVALVTINSGNINVSVKANDNIVINEYVTEENGLTYIDFQKDVIEDRYNTLDLIATSLKITIDNSENSLNVKNKIDLSDLIGKSLVYIIIDEGKNILPSHEYFNDYHLFISNIINGETNEVLQRELIAAANQTVVDSISEIVLEEFETLSFQIVFWGDYDRFVGNNYLQDNYLFNVIIETIQEDGEFS